MKMLFSALACAALMTTFVSANAAGPADGTKYLGDRHVARGMQCETCHEKDLKIKMNGELEVCTSCHGDYAAMIKKTEGRHETNPHAQHEGLLPCTECHKGHKEGVNYCGGCHNFGFKVP